MNDRILRVTRGETAEIYRIRLLEDGTASLQRFLDGSFGPARLFRGDASPGGFDAGRENSARKMENAIRYVSAYLNGAVNVGERDLLSPTSALTRNVRWFPGDVQMLRTSFSYVRELFPSAQFHVTQLFRRVFGDICFLSLVVLSSAFWLRTDAPVATNRLAAGLQVVSMMAIIGFDRYWEPLRFRWRKLKEAQLSGRGWRMFCDAPAFLLSQLALGTVSVVINTLMGLANLIIHPLKIIESWRQLGGGKTLEWKASSTSIGQDVRGWPVKEFLQVYRPALQVGLGAAFLCLWLMTLGAPTNLLGLNGIGIFVASFLTVVLYAWCSGLPYTLDGVPRYRLTKKEFAALTLTGLGGCLFSVLLFRAGMYPMPAFEGSVGLVTLFLSASALLALAFPAYYVFQQRAHDSRHNRRPRERRRAWPIAAGIFTLSAIVPWRPSLHDHVSGLSTFFHLDERRWRMPEPERQVYEDVQRTLRRHGKMDPEPLLRAEGDQPTLARQAANKTPDLRDLKGIPSARLPRLTAADSLELPELYALPQKDRITIVKPERHFVAPEPLATVEPRAAAEAGRKENDVAQRRAAAVTPRRLATAELTVQDDFIAAANYPWISREELRRLGQPTASDERMPLAEMARAYRWDDIRDLWDKVEAAARGGVPDRVRLQRLRDGVEGVVGLGQNPTADVVESFLDEELSLIEAWSREYPNVPLAAFAEGPLRARSRFFQIAQFLRDKKWSRAELARNWRLDYVDAYWHAPQIGEAVHQIFRERPRSLPWERWELDWEGNDTLKKRWEDLETEQAVAMKMWRAAATNGADPSPEQLRGIVEFLEKVLGPMLAGDARGPYRVFADLFQLEGADAAALKDKDTVAALLASRIWAEAMGGRVAEIVSRAAVGEELPGTEGDRSLIRATAQIRYPDDGGDPLLRRVFDWLVLVDGAQTYKELAAGYDRFGRDMQELGLPLQGLARAPALDERQLFRDLVDLWREVPSHFADIPVRDDLVAEFLCHTAYFSSADGKTPRTPRQLLEDFHGLFATVDALMKVEPPAEIQELANRHFVQMLGRTSRSGAGRRFFAWWMAAVQSKIVQNNYDHHRIAKTADVETTARAWAEVLRSGARRWPRLPWSHPGFAEFFLNLEAVQNWTADELWDRFDPQLGEADRLMARHVVPFKTFEALVDRRIQERTGSPNLDPTLRRSNAVVALAALLSVVRRNGIDGFDGNPALLTERFALLYEKVTRDYPQLYWDGEGMLEYFLLVGLRQGWDLYRTVSHFDPEWSLANALAATGMLARFTEVARKAESSLTPDERSIHDFVEVQALRLRERTGLKCKNPRSRAMNALISLSTLVMSAGEEGLIPDEHGETWSKERVQTWAAALEPGQLTPATRTWVDGLLARFSDLYRAMAEAGPHFPWHKGAIVETNLLAMDNAAATVDEVRAGLGAGWKAASDLTSRGVLLPAAFEEQILRESKEDLRRKIAAVRGVSPLQIADAEVMPDDRSLISLNATLVLAEVIAQIRADYGLDPDPSSVANRILDVQRLGPTRYPAIPWLAKGFVPSLVVAAYRQDFRDDFWKYARFIDVPTLDELLAQLARRQRESPGAWSMPADVVADVRALMRIQTGRTPSSDEVVVFQALRDGVALLREFLPETPLTLDHALTMARLRAAVRALSGDYPELHILRTEDQSVRIGFAERLAALAMKQGLAAGHDPDDPLFVSQSIALVKDRFLKSMKTIYAPMRDSLFPEEIAYYQQTIRDEARADNPRRAAKYALSAESLSLPDVKEDDVVADAALYEILYATEIGQDQKYLVDLFSIFDRIRSRPESRAAFHRGLDEIDGHFQGELRRAGESGFETWRESASFRRWWKERGDFIKTSRGRVMALARTFALVKRKAFLPSADESAKASFARFGPFDDYLQTFFDDFEGIRRVPELDAALAGLRAEDPFLADGVHFALALLQCHVMSVLYPDRGDALRALQGIGSFLPAVTDDYRRILGFSPRLESGVPLYDARISFLRHEVQGGPGTDLLRRQSLVQRGVQRWTQSYFLKHAYKVLFFRELDAEDPTPVPRFEQRGPLRPVTAALEKGFDRVLPRTVGDLVTTFLEVRLPRFLQEQTGSGDVSVWIAWLMEHGEIGLDGQPTGQNPYADEVAEYERRLSHYRARVRQGRSAGNNVRAEEQRINDIEKEYDSFKRQVRWLADGARDSAALTACSRRDFGESMRLHVALPLVLVVLLAALAAWFARRRGLGAMGRRAVALVCLGVPLAAATVLPLAVALAPERAADWSRGILEQVRLLERDGEGHAHLRGAAAQIAKIRPWEVLTRFAEFSHDVVHD